MSNFKVFHQKGTTKTSCHTVGRSPVREFQSKIIQDRTLWLLINKDYINDNTVLTAQELLLAVENTFGILRSTVQRSPNARRAFMRQDVTTLEFSNVATLRTFTREAIDRTVQSHSDKSESEGDSSFVNFIRRIVFNNMTLYWSRTKVEKAAKYFVLSDFVVVWTAEKVVRTYWVFK